MKYTLSFYEKKTDKVLIRPKWFEFWKKPKLENRNIWERKFITINTNSDEEASEFFGSPLMDDLLKGLSNYSAQGFQLEKHSESTQSVSYTHLTLPTTERV